MHLLGLAQEWHTPKLIKIALISMNCQGEIAIFWQGISIYLIPRFLTTPDEIRIETT